MQYYTSIENIKVSSLNNIRDTIKNMDSAGIGFIVIVNELDEVIGIFTDGDFRKAILKGASLDDNIMKFANKNFMFLDSKYDVKEIINIFKTTVFQQLPVLENNKLIDVITKTNVFYNNDEIFMPKKLNIPVVIMAGGKGTRLEPFTHILPKSLIPIGKKPILEIIMDEYSKYGIKQFYISVNHKANMIKAFFDENDTKNQIKYINESVPLGTAGSLKFIEGELSTPFFVSNCDIIIKEDYSKIYEFHKNGMFELTLVASMQYHMIPYGVCELDKSGNLQTLKEKPQFDFLINTGMYILNSTVLSFIPEKSFFNMTNLIDKLQKNNQSIGVYPISEKSYIDIGQWAEYKKVINILSF